MLSKFVSIQRVTRLCFMIQFCFFFRIRAGEHTNKKKTHTKRTNKIIKNESFQYLSSSCAHFFFRFIFWVAPSSHFIVAQSVLSLLSHIFFLCRFKTEKKKIIKKCFIKNGKVVCVRFSFFFLCSRVIVASVETILHTSKRQNTHKRLRCVGVTPSFHC